MAGYRIMAITLQSSVADTNNTREADYECLRLLFVGGYERRFASGNVFHHD